MGIYADLYLFLSPLKLHANKIKLTEERGNVSVCFLNKDARQCLSGTRQDSAEAGSVLHS